MSIPIIQMLLAVSSAQELEAFLDKHSVTFGSFTSKGSKTHLTRDGGGTNGDRQKWTFSAWVKRHIFSDGVQVIFSHGSGSNGEGYIGFNTDDALYFGNDGHNNFVASGRKFRDSGWYHIIWAVDSTQASADDRWKIYINGELMPASDYGSPSITQNGNGYIQYHATEAMDPCIGERLRHHFNSANFSAPFKGQIAQVHFIDGAQKAPSDFASTKDGVYRPIEYTGTFGTNGYYLPLDGVTPIGKAATGQGSDWTPKYFGGSMPVSKATGGLPILNTINEGHVIVPGITKDYGTETPQFIKDSGCVGFNGSSNWLKSPVGTDMDFGTGDFTVECWVFVTQWNSANSNNPSGMNVLCRASTVASNTGFLLWFDNSGYLKCELDVGNSATQLNTGTTTNGISQGKWTHLAVSRAGTAAKLFVNGIVRAQATDSTNISGNNDLIIGSDIGNSAYFFNGFISNLRIVKGTAVYSGSASNGTQVFTPPAAPLENVTNTKLICCNSSKSPYHSTVGAVTHPQSPNDGTIWSSKITEAGGGWTKGPENTTNGSLDPSYRAMTNGNAVLVTFSGVSIPCKVVEVYVENNYESTCTVTISGTTYTSTSGSIHRFVQSGNLTQITVVNNVGGGRTYFEGIKIDGVILKDNSTENIGCAAIESEVAGSCVLAMPLAGEGDWWQWGSTFDISDEISGGKSIPTTMMTQSSCLSWNGNSNYYGAAHNFDGGSDYIKPQTSDTHFQWDRGDFTVEAWVYPEANGADSYYRRIWLSDGPTGNATNNIQLAIVPTSGVAQVWTGGTSGTEIQIDGTTKITQNTWHHVAMVRRDGTIKLYVNGVEEGSASSWYNFQPQVDQGYNFKAQPYIGSYDGSMGDFYGRIQDVRAYKGVAKYQQNFIVGSTTPNLLAASTYINESESSDNNPVSTPTTGSVYLDGTNDMVRIYGGSAVTMGTGEYTIEGWMYPTIRDDGPNDGIWQIHTDATGYGNHVGSMSQQWEKTSGSVRVNNMMEGDTWYNVGEAQGENAAAGGKWHHVAMTRNSDGTVTSWMNGKENGTFTNTNNMTGTTFALGAYWSTSNFFQGHLSNFRVLKGCSLYNHKFTPPTKALTTQPGSVNEAGTVWSDYCTATPSGWHGPSPVVNWFDGSETTFCNHNSSNDTITFTPPTALSGVLRIYGWVGSTSSYSILVNGKDTGVDWPVGSTTNKHWVEVGSFESITEIKFTGTGGWYGAKISLNGELLLNPTFAVAKTALLCANDSENPLQAVLPMLTNRTTHTITNNGCVASDDNPFGTTTDGSVFFDGSNDYLSVANNNMFAFDSADFSIELWLKSKMDTGTYQNFLATRGAAGVTTGWTFSIESNGTIGFYSNGHQFTSGGLVKANEWTHIALERRSGNLKCYQDGKKIADASPTTQNFTNNSFTIGIHNDANGAGWFSGWISNVRLTKEFARVHGEDNSAPVPAKAYTMGGSSFLGCQSKTDVTANVSREDAGIRLYGKPKATTFNPFDSNKPTAGKYATLNNLEAPGKSTGTLDDGNLFLYGDDYIFRKSNIWLGKTGPTTGKFYWEVYSISDQEGVSMGSEMIAYCGITSNIEQDGGEIVNATDKAWFGGGGSGDTGPYLKKYDEGSSTSMGIFGSQGVQTYGFALDLDNRHLTFYADGRPVTGDDSIPDPKTTYIIPCIMATNSGGAADWSDTIWNFGQKAWKYPPPQGYVGISYQNAHNTSIEPDKHFGLIKWSGSNNFGDVLSYGFEPAFVWMKQTNDTRDWISSDIVSGIGCHLELNDLSNQNTTTQYPYLSKVSSAGAHLYGGSSSGGNISGRDYVGYAWKGGHPENKSLTNGGVQFDGTDDYLSISHTDLNPGDAAFTIECWIYPDASSSGNHNRRILRNGDNNATGSFALLWNSSSEEITVNYNQTTLFGSNAVQEVPRGKWTHIAFVREGTGSNETKLYIDGVKVREDTFTVDLSLYAWQIGTCTTLNASQFSFGGSISNVRLVRGTAVYTSNFTPSLEPLTNITNTKLLCCQDLTDASAGAVKPGTITVHGGAFQQNIGGPTLRYCKDGVSYPAMSSIYNGHDHALVKGCSVNTEGGFSVIKYQGNGSAATIPHGLSKAPSFIITKSLNEGGSPSWSTGVYHVDGSYSGAQMYMGGVTNGSSGQRSDTNLYTSVDAAGFAIGSWVGINGNGTDYIGYCWHDLEGLQKFGKFSGETSNDGPYVHLGFRPAMVVVKRSNGTGKWACSDDVRNNWNKTWGSDLSLYLNSDVPETSSASLNIDLLSGGFKLRSQNTEYNIDTGWYIYCAWARSTGLQALGR